MVAFAQFLHDTLHSLAATPQLVVTTFNYGRVHLLYTAFAQYQPTCRSMDDMIDRSTLLSCTRNDLCDTANCNINNRWLDHYSLKLTLLSCRNPPAVHMVLGNSDSTVFEADVDHTINDIDISGVGDVDITLNQLQDQNAIGFGVGWS